MLTNKSTTVAPLRLEDMPAKDKAEAARNQAALENVLAKQAALMENASQREYYLKALDDLLNLRIQSGNLEIIFHKQSTDDAHGFFRFF